MNTIAIEKVPNHDHYELKENNSTVLEIKYNPELHTARIETNDEKRVFIIEDEGLLRNRRAIKNEYGIKLGSLSFDNFSNTHGSVEIENKRFRFSIDNASGPIIRIFKDSRKAPIYTCLLSISEEESSDVKNHSSSSIIAVTWYLFLKMFRKKEQASFA